MFHSGVMPHWLPSEFDLHHSDILCIFAQWFKPLLTQGVEAITLNHHDRRWRLFHTVRLPLHPVDSHTSEHIIPVQNIMMIILTFYPHVSLVNRVWPACYAILYIQTDGTTFRQRVVCTYFHNCKHWRLVDFGRWCCAVLSRDRLSESGFLGGFF